jgi:F-type H+-transporting ATPase subunit epsilon
MATTFSLSVITPERAVLDTDATFVAFPAWDGEIGILAHRAPLMAKLGVGWLRADTVEGKRVLLVDGGFAQVVDNKVSVLTEYAQAPDEINVAAADQALAAAQAMKITDDASAELRERAIKRAKLQKKAGSRS